MVRVPRKLHRQYDPSKYGNNLRATQKQNVRFTHWSLPTYFIINKKQGHCDLMYLLSYISPKCMNANFTRYFLCFLIIQLFVENWFLIEQQ
jgi:hypothetical protein